MRDARAALREQGLPDVEVTYVGDWYDHPRFIEASAAQVEEAIAKLPDAERARATLIFTAHSIPSSMAARYPYQEQYETTARLIAARLRALHRSSASRGDGLSEPQRTARGSVART